jgi:hypothetical protein
MIRKKLPSAIASDARVGCAVKSAVQLATMPLREVAKSAQRQGFLVRPAHLPPSETMLSVSSGVLSCVLVKWRARQVLPHGRQKAPRKYLKNNEKSSPGFFLGAVQRIESRSASGHGIGVGEWG